MITTSAVLSLLSMALKCGGHVEFVIKQGNNPAACGELITFTCIANNTNAVSILQNGHLCQTFERSGSTGSNMCSNLSIELIRAIADTDFITTFEIEGRYRHDDTKQIIVQCMDATTVSKILTLQVNSKPCHPSPNCTYNCSNCLKDSSVGFQTEVPQHCHGFQNTTIVAAVQNGYQIPNSAYCFGFCGENLQKIYNVTFSIILTNMCKETLETSPCIGLTSDELFTFISMSTTLFPLSVFIVFCGG